MSDPLGVNEDIFEEQNEAYEYAGRLNPYLYSNDPRLDEAAQKICSDIGFEGQKKLILNQLKLLLLNIIELKRSNPKGVLRYGRSNAYWKEFTKDMPNPWGISSKIDHVIDRMKEAELLHVRLGFVGEKIKRQTRIQPSAKLMENYIKPFKLLELPVELHKEFPLVHVHLKHKSKYIKGKIYHVRREAKGSTAIPNQLKQMKEQLRSYNTLIKNSDIRLGDIPETKELLQRVNFNAKNRSYRVFSDSDITAGGRIYGGWWQDISSDLRKHILINGSSTIELDYKSQHACMLYGYCLGQHMENILGADKDAYTFGNYPRALGKAIFTIALNVRNRRNLRQALLNKFTKEFSSDDEGKKNTAKQCLAFIEQDFEGVMDAFEDLHEPVLKPTRYLYSKSMEEKWWRRFQFYDSQICTYVLEKMTLSKTPCLSVHDSFIVEKDKEGALRNLMVEAYTKAKHIPDLSKCIPEIKSKKKIIKRTLRGLECILG